MKPGMGVRGLGPHLDDDACTDLVQGYLTFAAQDAAFDHLRRCHACEEAVRQRAAELERLRAATYALERPAKPRATRWIPIAAAAAVALVAFAALLPFARKPQPTPEIGWLPAANDLTVLRGGVADSNLISGLEAYDRRDLTTAIALLRNPQAGGPYGPYERIRRVYLGSALAAAGEYREAVAVIQSVPSLATVPEPWGQELRRAYYVSLRKSGDRQTADSLMRVLAAQTGETDDGDRGLD